MKKHNKKYDITGFLTILITLMMIVLAVNMFFIGDKIIIAKAEGNISQGENQLEEAKENFFVHIMNKSMSILEISYVENGGEDTNTFIKNLFGKVVDINYKNPKSLIKAQISMIKDVENDIEISEDKETEDNDTAEIYISNEKNTSANNNKIAEVTNKNNPYKEDIQVINENNIERQGLTSEIQIVSTPVPAPIKINYSIDKPLVFIYHTHGTESYKPEMVGNYHSLNRQYTVIKVGEELKKIIESSGFKVIHDDTLHDYPSYEGSYKRSLETLNKNLKANPSLKVVFDIHRDGINNVDDLQTKQYETIRNGSYVVINGEKVARFSIVVGEGNENIEQLKQFAYYIKAVSDELYPGLAKQVIFKKYKYNEYKSDYYALFEIGNNTNTIDESVNTAKYLGEVINQALRKAVKSSN